MPDELVDERPCDECFAKWPKCAISVCENKCCLRLNSKYCWPHTPGIDPKEIAVSLEEEDSEVVEARTEPTTK